MFEKSWYLHLENNINKQKEKKKEYHKKLRNEEAIDVH